MAEIEIIDPAAQRQVAQVGAEPIPRADALLTPPYSDDQLQAIDIFFKRRQVNPVGFTYTEGGDLKTEAGAQARVRKAGRAEEGTIQLKRFLPITPTEREVIEQDRLEKLVELDMQYEVARKALADAMARYSMSREVGPVLAANVAVSELDARRSAARSAVRSIQALDNPETRLILLDQPYEKRKLVQGQKDPYLGQVFQMSYYDHLPQFEFGKYVPDEEVPPLEPEEGAEAEAMILPDEAGYRQRLRDGRVGRIFFEANSDVNGFLSPMWPVTFTMDNVQYACALQAYEAERARELGKLELRASLLKTRSGRTVRIFTKNVEGHPKNAKALWFKIYTAIYQQNEELKKKLLATGTDTLIYAEPREGPSGIGLAHTDGAALDSAKWTGENAAGLAQEEVRARARDETLQEAPGDTDIREAAITEEEQEKARVGAIINAARRRGGGRY